MSRNPLLLTLVLLLLPVTAAQAADSTEFLPAGMLLTCTTDEPNFSSKTAEVGDPILCHISSISAFGHQVFPRGAYLSGHLQDYSNPGHLYGKGWLAIQFERLVLPGQAVLPLTAKVVAVPHYRISKEGKILGRGHAKRDAIEWGFPVLWPVKVLTLPARGPYPALKGEQRITLRLMEDVVIPVLPTSARFIPMPPWVRPSTVNVSAVPFGNGGYRLVNATAAKVQEIPPSKAATSGHLSGPVDTLTLIVLKDYSAVLAQTYRLDGDNILCALENGDTKLIPVASVDFPATVRINREREVPFVLQSAPGTDAFAIQ